jgi:flagellin
MAINDISLTTGMRSNLLALQNTVTLLDRTQNRLSSGKKVNTAMDNPVSFFAAQALNARASVIDGLKDAMGQAVQTITAADKGITAISSMIEQAKGIAQSALSAERGTPAAAGSVTGAVRLNDISAVSGYATAPITLTGVGEDDVFVPAFPAAITARAKLAINTPSAQFQLVPGDMNATAENLKNFINNSIHLGI